MKTFARAVCIVLAGLLGAPAAQAAGRPLKITVTTTMVADMVRQVGGDRVEVAGLMGPGVDPHLYKAAATDVTKLSRADAIFYSGLLLEGRMADLFTKMARSGKKVFAVTESLPEKDLLEPESFGGHPDPHVWGDPRLWAKCVDVVVSGLTEVDPAGGKHYAGRGAAAKAGMLALHEWAAKRFAEVPKANRVLITSHDAFNYFGRAFDLEVVGVQGISTVTDAGLADIAKTVDFIKQRKVKSIFIESSVPPAAINRISSDAGVKVGGELYSDACGAPGEMHQGGGESYDVGTYIGMIKHNVNTIVDALK